MKSHTVCYLLSHTHTMTLTIADTKRKKYIKKLNEIVINICLTFFSSRVYNTTNKYLFFRALKFQNLKNLKKNFVILGQSKMTWSGQSCTGLGLLVIFHAGYYIVQCEKNII